MNLLLNTPPLDVYEHMALDETLVKLRPGAVSLRFFNWREGAAITYGYAQFYQEVLRGIPAEFNGEMTRRPTGGGIVFHTDDLTFSVIFEHTGRTADIYKKMHTLICAELSKRGEERLSLGNSVSKEKYQPSCGQEASACFINPVENDVLFNKEKKILGGALRRFGTTFLYQGSLQLPGARQNPLYKQAIICAIRSFLALDLKPTALDGQTLQTARLLASSCYRTPFWKEKF